MRKRPLKTSLFFTISATVFFFGTALATELATVGFESFFASSSVFGVGSPGFGSPGVGSGIGAGWGLAGAGAGSGFGLGAGVGAGSWAARDDATTTLVARVRKRAFMAGKM